MLIALILVSAFAAAGWIIAWRARDRALDALDLAHTAGERLRICEGQNSAVRLSETLSSNALTDARDHIVLERERSASLRHQLGKANADIDVLRRKIADLTPTGDPIYDSTTKRLQNPAALARTLEP